MRAVMLGVALALAVAVGSGAAAAKPARAVDPVLGGWVFETAVYKGSCRMKGEMSIRPAPQPNRYTCSFVATETCEGLKVRADQSCTAVKEGKTLTIKATILKLTPPDILYTPDDWSLTIVDSSKMIGELRSADIAPVTFYRGMGAIS
ncbi:MAG: hypothetical protein KJS97_07360 [Alphaproteobacteria bacterium]|nr:hypothetical protein [Alphaproteobacteria bacterium]